MFGNQTEWSPPKLVSSNRPNQPIEREPIPEFCPNARTTEFSLNQQHICLIWNRSDPNFDATNRTILNREKRHFYRVVSPSLPSNTTSQQSHWCKANDVEPGDLNLITHVNCLKTNLNVFKLSWSLKALEFLARTCLNWRLLGNECALRLQIVKRVIWNCR